MHRREWTCPTCSQLFSMKSAFKAHLSTHNPSLVGSELEALILQSEEPMDQFPTTACSLCDEWEEQLKDPRQNEKRAFLNDGKEVAPYGTKAQFRRHLGRHMEQLALFALPRNVDGDLNEDTDEEIVGELNHVGSSGSTGTSLSEDIAAEIEHVGNGPRLADKELAMLEEQADHNPSSVDPTRADLVVDGDQTELAEHSSYLSLEDSLKKKAASLLKLWKKLFWKCVGFSHENCTSAH